VILEPVLENPQDNPGLPLPRKKCQKSTGDGSCTIKSFLKNNKNIVPYKFLGGKGTIRSKPNVRLLYFFPKGKITGIFPGKAVKKSGKENKVKKPVLVYGFFYFRAVYRDKVTFFLALSLLSCTILT